MLESGYCKVAPNEVRRETPYRHGRREACPHEQSFSGHQWVRQPHEKWSGSRSLSISTPRPPRASQHEYAGTSSICLKPAVTMQFETPNGVEKPLIHEQACSKEHHLTIGELAHRVKGRGNDMSIQQILLVREHEWTEPR